MFFHFSLKQWASELLQRNLAAGHWFISISGLRNNNVHEGNSLGWQYLLQLAFINTLSLQSSTPWTPRNFCIEKGYLIGYLPIYWIVLKISKWKLIIKYTQKNQLTYLKNSKPIQKHCLCLDALVLFNSLQSRELEPTRLLCPWDFPGKNTEVGCHFLLQGIFLTQGSNPHRLRWQAGSSLKMSVKIF